MTGVSKSEAALREAMSKAFQLKEVILSILDKEPSLNDEGSYIGYTPSAVLRGRLHYLNETFRPNVKEVPLESVNRLGSMYSGPFYCSAQYPQPVTKSGAKLFPIVQIDLEWLGSLCRRSFGKGLMQLWFNNEAHSESFRIIPDENVRAEELVPFDAGGLESAMADSYLIREDHQFLRQLKCREIVGLSLVGVTCPDLISHLEYVLGDVTEAEDPVHLSLLQQVSDLEDLVAQCEGDHFFGRFNPLQMSVEEFYPMQCFMSIEEWGSGNAQIFYIYDDDRKRGKFSFYHCARG
jgi:hypothetical protein